MHAIERMVKASKKSASKAVNTELAELAAKHTPLHPTPHAEEKAEAKAETAAVKKMLPAQPAAARSTDVERVPRLLVIDDDESLSVGHISELPELLISLVRRHRSRIRDLFVMFDKNEDGYIDFVECDSTCRTHRI